MANKNPLVLYNGQISEIASGDTISTTIAPGTGGSGMTNPMTTLGDIIYEDATPAAARLAGNTTATKKFLSQTGNGTISAAPNWAALLAADIPDISATYIKFSTSAQSGAVTLSNTAGSTLMKLNGGAGFSSAYTLDIGTATTLGVAINGEVNIGNGGYTDPFPGQSYDLKMGGAGKSIATLGAVSFDNQKVKTDGSGNLTLTSGAINLFTGTASIAPLKYTAGTNLTTPVAGAMEFDGVQLYNTIDTTSGRAAVLAEQYFHLTAAGSTVGTTIGNYFGTTSNISLVANAYYEIDIYLFYLKTTAGTVTWTLTNSAAPTSQNIIYEMSPASGIVAPPGTAAMLSGQIYNSTTAAQTVVTASLTTAVNHYARFKIFLRNGTGTSLKIQATCSAGTITPGINSYWMCKRRSPNNIGTFAA